ncbi:MAG: PepSY domain-containing protein [Rhizobiaceae bacterium]|nr:PepSY domain-containing protein [Rhizobiaceae bacterium]
MRLLPAAALAIAALCAGPAPAAEKCDVPLADWQPREALEAKLKSDGWQIQAIKSEDGCYEASAIDAKGEPVDAYFNPKTFERVGTDDEQG